MAGSWLTRRHFLRAAVGAAALTPLLAACQPQTVEVTKIVEKEKPVEVTKVVEKAVEVTKVVEKAVEKKVEVVVTATPLPAKPINATISWWTWFNEEIGGPIGHKQIALFNKKYPNVTVKMQPAGNLTVTIAAGTAADVIMINVPTGYYWIGHGAIMNLQPYINADKSWQDDLSKFHADGLAATQFRGDQYAITQSLETTGTLYNDDMIREAGLKTPAELGKEWTWDKFAEYAVKLTKGTTPGKDKVWGAFLSPDPQSGLGDLAYPLGARWVNEDSVSTGIDTKEFAQASNFFLDLVKNKKVGPDANTQGAGWQGNYAAFVNLQICMQLSGDWAYGWVLTRQVEGKKFKMDWAQSPFAPNGKSVAVGHYVSQHGFGKTRQQDAVVAFLREYSTQAIQNESTNGWENYPVLSPRLDAQDFFWNKKLVPNADGMKASFASNQTYPRSAVADPTPTVITPTNNLFTDLMTGKDTRKVEEACAALAKQVNSDFAKAAQNMG